MEFKKIQLNGFKSFADKTNFLITDLKTNIKEFERKNQLSEKKLKRQNIKVLDFKKLIKNQEVNDKSFQDELILKKDLNKNYSGRSLKDILERFDLKNYQDPRNLTNKKSEPRFYPPGRVLSDRLKATDGSGCKSSITNPCC